MTTSTFRAIADPTRRAILDHLRLNPANASELASQFKSSRPAVSRHLRVLRDADLVKDTPSGRERIYRINPAPLADVTSWLDNYRVFWQSSLAHLKTNLESEK